MFGHGCFERQKVGSHFVINGNWNINNVMILESFVPYKYMYKAIKIYLALVVQN